MRRSLLLTILALTVALVLVPTLARARQQVERTDATRLSVKHSWIGVAPPTRGSIAPTPVTALLAAEVRLQRPEPLVTVVHAPVPVRRAIVCRTPEPSRGPPSAVR